MMNDLLHTLDRLLKNATLTVAVRLKCVLAGLRALRNQGYVVDIDVKVRSTSVSVFDSEFFIFRFFKKNKKKKKNEGVQFGTVRDCVAHTVDRACELD